MYQARTIVQAFFDRSSENYAHTQTHGIRSNLHEEGFVETLSSCGTNERWQTLGTLDGNRNQYLPSGSRSAGRRMVAGQTSLH